jgi:single-stranded DNA-binding protein
LLATTGKVADAVNDFFKEDILTVRREDFHNIEFWRNTVEAVRTWYEVQDILFYIPILT